MSDSDTKRTSRTDWDRLAKMTDEEIDYSDIPPLTDAFSIGPNSCSSMRSNSILMSSHGSSVKDEIIQSGSIKPYASISLSMTSDTSHP